MSRARHIETSPTQPRTPAESVCPPPPLQHVSRTPVAPHISWTWGFFRSLLLQCNQDSGRMRPLEAEQHRSTLHSDKYSRLRRTLANNMFKFATASPLKRSPMLILSKRSATTITSLNDKKLINLLARLDKFDSESKIFDKLDELYLLSQRKGFFNLNANNLEFLSNNNKINDNMNNLYNFNNLNRLVSNQYSNLLMLPSPSKMSSGGSSGINSANLSPMPRSSPVPGVKINIDNGNILSNNSNFFKSSYSPVANSIPGLNAFMSTSMSNYSKNAPVDKYLNLLQGLARNDVELKNRIEQVLEAFNDEDDFFFNYVLEFWISGKSFNKRKAKKLQEETGNGQLPSNLTM